MISNHPPNSGLSRDIAESNLIQQADNTNVASFNYDSLYNTDNLTPKYSFMNSSFLYKSSLLDENDYLNEIYFNRNPLEMETVCKKLDNETCGLTSSCVYVGNNKCVPGNKKGPYTTYSDVNLDYYYYRGKCYGNCPGQYGMTTSNTNVSTTGTSNIFATPATPIIARSATSSTPIIDRSAYSIDRNRSASSIDKSASSSATTVTTTTPSSATIGTTTTPSIATPGTASIATPGTASIATPGTASIATPGTASIATPGTASIAIPGTASIAIPGTASIATPGTASIATPGTASIATPGTASIATPGTASIATPGTAITPTNVASFTTTPYATTPSATTPYTTTPSATTPYATTPYATTPSATTPYATTPYATTPYATTPYATTPYATTPYATTPYATTPYATTPYITTPNLPYLSSGLTNYYPFDSGKTVANYASGTAVNDITLYGGAVVSSSAYMVGNGSLYLNGVNQYAEIASSALNITTNGLSIACWFNYSSSGGWARLFDFGNGPGNSNIFYAPRYGVFCVINGRTVVTPRVSEITDNKWHHLCWTIAYTSLTEDTNTWNIYIDGKVVYTTTAGNYPNITTRTNNYIGKSNWPDPYATGYVDDFRIYNRVISPSEVSSLLQV